ncbi:MAG: 16S rRNA processing protein RimM [Bacteroidales bacterium]|nr:16S rRNA processing protein RimM [Bacteroidales bacterium]
MILKNEIFPIGQIMKLHGHHGEMTFSTTSNILDEVDVPFIILEPEGILVPFYIESIRMKTATTGSIKLERVDSEEQARDFTGQTIYLPNIYLDEINTEEIEVGYFVGFEIIDKDNGNIGHVTAIDDSTANTLFIVGNETNETLIPITDEFITEIDHEKKIIRLALPKGLLDL